MGVYFGQFVGDDKYRGWDSHNKAIMESTGNAALNTWQGTQGWGNQSKDPYGLANKLIDTGVTDFGFDPTSFESIGQALAKKNFYDTALGSIEEGPRANLTSGGQAWKKR